MNANERKYFFRYIQQLKDRIHHEYGISINTTRLNLLQPNYASHIILFAFICVMHMDVRMPQAQDAQARRNLRSLFNLFI